MGIRPTFRSSRPLKAALLVPSLRSAAAELFVSWQEELTMARQRKVGVCALCDKTRQVTREHVPPKNLYLPPRPRNTITVPVCEPCNHGYHLDDKYFRVYVAVGAKPDTRLCRLWKEKVVGSSFLRGDGLKGRLSDDQDKVNRHHLTVEPLRTVDNKVLDNEWLPLVQSFDASRIKAVVEKIVRCLHFHLSGAPLSRHTRLEVNTTPLTPADLQLLFSQRTGEVGDFEEFVFRREDTGHGSFRFLMAFYGLHTFTVKAEGAANIRPCQEVLSRASEPRS